jgi:hypothetical protein
MKKLVIILIVFICSCTILEYDDINNHRGSVILEIERRGGTRASDFYIKDSLGRYDIITVKSQYEKLFNVGDTL